MIRREPVLPYLMLTRRNPFAANDDGPGIGIASLAIRIAAAATFVLFVVSAVFVAQATAGEFQGEVIRVHDGDTLTVLLDREQVRVRLVDIDAPELGQAFGRRSRESLAGMCAGAVATVQDRGHDRYGRTLGHVTCGSYDANAEQVRRGMAWVYVRYAPKGSPLYTAQTEAKLERRGLWIEPGAVAPWEWRRRFIHSSKSL